MSEKLDIAITAEDFELLNYLAQHPMDWEMGLRQPIMHMGNNEFKEVGPAQLTKLLQANLIFGTFDFSGGRLGVMFRLTTQGADRFLDQFPGYREAIRNPGGQS